ncbi:succinate dehydrogenase [Sphingobacteriales bacterium UPWRP_1]|nr:succinate dehydrogenase [Sphingobacteriales bacterium TSM_CSM]PSJ72405.1 succinate dehydrogenase [Sphingobacteriales bacterium UPWRP_1]
MSSEIATKTYSLSWLGHFFSSSVGRKLIMSLTGLFLCLFLAVHMSGNLQLLKSDGGRAFNEYAYFMTHFAPIKVVSYITYFLILLHAFDGVALALKNRQARPVKYAATPAGSTWASRNMALLGIIIFFFLVVHLKSFWFEYKFGAMPSVTYDGKEFKDLYSIVKEAFSQWWYVLLYLVSLVALAYHLIHGFQSAFQTLGLSHKKYTPIIQAFGWIFSIGVNLGFAIQPLYLFFIQQS